MTMATEAFASPRVPKYLSEQSAKHKNYLIVLGEAMWSMYKLCTQIIITNLNQLICCIYQKNEIFQ
jgi:hypothetical protein